MGWGPGSERRGCRTGLKWTGRRCTLERPSCAVRGGVPVPRLRRRLPLAEVRSRPRLSKLRWWLGWLAGLCDRKGVLKLFYSICSKLSSLPKKNNNSVFPLDEHVDVELLDWIVILPLTCGGASTLFSSLRSHQRHMTVPAHVLAHGQTFSYCGFSHFEVTANRGFGLHFPDDERWGASLFTCPSAVCVSSLEECLSSSSACF